MKELTDFGFKSRPESIFKQQDELALYKTQLKETSKVTKMRSTNLVNGVLINLKHYLRQFGSRAENNNLDQLKQTNNVSRSLIDFAILTLTYLKITYQLLNTTNNITSHPTKAFAKNLAGSSQAHVTSTS